MIIIIIFFCGFLFLLTLGNLHNFRVKNPTLHNFSILIAARNEEKNIPALIESLKALDYPSELYEIIIVDDASTDRTFELLNNHTNNLTNFQILRIQKKDTEFKGKKAALSLATKNAKHEFLLFTDADCIVKPNWIWSYNNYIKDDIGAVIGHYIIKTNNSFVRFLKLINAGTLSSTTGLGFPASGSGGNLMIRKKTFFEVGGYTKIKDAVSGDDKLMINMIKKSKWKIAYNSESPVFTGYIEDKKIRNEQYKRHYGKFGMFTIGFKILSVAIFLFYLYFPISIFFENGILNFGLYLLFGLFYWLSVIYKFKHRFYLIDIVYILYYPYFLSYYAIYGMFFKWEWK